MGWPDTDARFRARTDGTPSRRPPLLLRLMFVIVACGVPILIIAAIYLFRGHQAFLGSPTGWLICMVFAASGVLYVVIGSVGNAVYLARVRRRGKADLVFHFTSSRMFRNGLVRLLGLRPAMIESNWCAVSATPAGLVIWLGRRPRKMAGVRWSSVDSVETDVVIYGGYARYSARISFTDAHGAAASMPLVNANADLVPLPSKAEVEWVVGELNRLRVLGTAARVL